MVHSEDKVYKVWCTNRYMVINMAYDQPVTVKLDSSTVKRLDRIAMDTNMTRSNILREAFYKYEMDRRKEYIEKYGIDEEQVLDMLGESIDDGSYDDVWMIRKGIKKEDVNYGFVVVKGGKIEKATEEEIIESLSDEYVEIYDDVVTGYGITAVKNKRRPIAYNKEFGVLVIA